MLLAYLAPAFREYRERGEQPGGRGSFPHAHRPWLHPEDFLRVDAVPPSGEAAGSDHAFMAEQLLDRYGIDVAILTGEEAIEVSTRANPHYAQALARAYNDWMVAEWLPRDDRLRGSLVGIVNPPNPKPRHWTNDAPRGTHRRGPAAAVERGDPGGTTGPGGSRSAPGSGRPAAVWRRRLPPLADAPARTATSVDHTSLGLTGPDR